MTSENLLDTPIEEQRPKNLSPLKTQNRIDYVINCLLLCLIVIAACTLPFAGWGSLLLVLLGMFVTGAYQMLSAIIGAIRGNTAKGIYFLSAAVYLGIFFLLLQLFDDPLSDRTEGIFLRVLFFIVLPTTGAIYYTYLCHQSLRRYD